MSGIDSTKLSKERDYYRDVVRKNNRATEQKVEANNERNAQAMDKQRENFISDKSKLEKNYQKNLEDIKEKTKDLVGNRSKRANENLERQRENFTREAQVKSKDFDQRLNDIKSSYKKAFGSEKELNQQLSEADNKRYSKNVKDVLNKTDDALRSNQEKMSDSVADLKDDFMRDTQKLVRQQEEQMKDLSKSEFQKQSQLKDQLSTNLDNTKRAHNAELESKQDYMDTRVGDLQNNFQTHSKEMAEDFSGRMNNFAQTQRSENLKANRENQKLVNDLNVEHNKELRFERIKGTKDNGAGDISQLSEDQKRLNSTSMTNNRIKHLQTELIDSKRDGAIQADKQLENFSKTFKDERMGNATLTERKLNAERRDKALTLANERVKAEKNLGNREYQNKLDRENFKRELELDKNNADIRLKNVSDNFTKTIKALEEKNKMAVDDLTTVTKKDKDEFMKVMNENRNNELYELKREFSRVMDVTIEGYEKRLGTYQRENEYLKLTMDEKINALTNQAQKNAETQKKLYEDMMTANDRESQMLNDQRQHTNKTETNRIITGFQKKIDKMQIDNDTKLKNLTTDYENKLKELTSSRNRDNMIKDMAQVQEIERVKNNFEDEKNRIVSQYQNQITEMKRGQEAQLEEMRNFKKLS